MRMVSRRSRLPSDSTNDVGAQRPLAALGRQVVIRHVYAIQCHILQRRERQWHGKLSAFDTRM